MRDTRVYSLEIVRSPRPELLAGRTRSDPDFIVLRFLSLAHEKGGRIWFPGCGLDPHPYTYAQQGCKVLATDFSSVAVRYQQRLAAAFLKENESAKVQGSFAVAEHDFTQAPLLLGNPRMREGLASFWQTMIAEMRMA